MVVCKKYLTVGEEVICALDTIVAKPALVILRQASHLIEAILRFVCVPPPSASFPRKRKKEDSLAVLRTNLAVYPEGNLHLFWLLGPV